MNQFAHRKILLVEDDPLLCMIEKGMLEKYSFQVVCVNSGEQAIEVMQNPNEIGLILMDIDLGSGLDGTETAQIILKNHDVPLIFLSSHTEREVVEKTEGITSYGYIVKNCGETVLVASIKMAFRLFEARKNEREKEEKIEENEKYLDTLLHTTRDGFWVVDLQGRMLDVNDAYCKLSGYTREEFLQLSIVDVDAIENPQEVLERIQNIQAKGSELFETKHRRKDGSVFEAEISVNFLNLYGGRFICFCRDITRRKQMERDLLEQKKRLQEAQHLSKVGSWELNLLSNTLSWSDEIFSIFEKEKSSVNFTFENFLEFVHPEDRTIVEIAYLSSLQNRTDYNIVHRLLFPDGRIKFVQEKAENFYDSDGVPIRSIGTVQDITQQILIQEELNQSNQRLKLILDTVPQSIFWKDREGKYLGCNSVFASTAGVDDPRNIQGLTDFDLPWIKEEAEKYRADDKFVIDTNKAKLHIIEPLTKSNGSKVFIDTSKLPLHDSAGNVFGVLGVYDEINKIRKVEEELLKELELLRTTIQSIPGLLFVIDENGNVLFINNNALSKLKISQREVIGKSFFDLFIERENRNDLFSKFQKSIRDEESLHFSYEIIGTSRVPIRVNWNRKIIKLNEQTRVVIEFGLES